MFSLWSGIADLLPYITEMQQAELSFVYPEPGYADEMYRYFPGKIHFAAARNLLTLPLAWVDTPLLYRRSSRHGAAGRGGQEWPHYLYRHHP